MKHQITTDGSKAMSSTLDECYTDRNLLVMGFAKLAHKNGWPIGYKEDQDTSINDFYVVFVDTPEGQVSWHVPRSLLEEFHITQYQKEWDGHGLREKQRRMANTLRNL